MRSKGRQELEAMLGVPVLAVVPAMVPAIARVRRQHRRSGKLALAACAAAVVVVALALLLAL